VTRTYSRFQARACNTLACKAVARSATHRHRARGPAPEPRAGSGARTATLPWRGTHGAGKRVPPPPPQRRRPTSVARCPREGPSLRRAAHLRTADGAVDTAHGRAGETDCARRGASNRATRWRQKPPKSRRNKSRRAGTITRGSSWARRTPEVSARGFRAPLGSVGGGRGAEAVRAP